MLASSDRFKLLISIGAMYSAESFNNRALIRSSSIALFVFKVNKGFCDTTKGKRFIIALPWRKGRWEKLSGIAAYKPEFFLNFGD